MVLITNDIAVIMNAITRKIIIHWIRAVFTFAVSIVSVSAVTIGATDKIVRLISCEFDIIPS